MISTMSDRRRNLFMAVADGVQTTFPMLYQFDRLTRCDEVLDYCFRNRITGHNLMALLNEQGKSVLNVISELLRRINKERRKSEVIVGKDYRI